MNATVAKQWLWRMKKIEMESLLRQSLSLNTYKICLTAILTHVVLKLCQNKNLRYWSKATLTLETRIGYICNTHGYQKEICNGFEMKLT